jgi:hypothetical protein
MADNDKNKKFSWRGRTKSLVISFIVGTNGGTFYHLELSIMSNKMNPAGKRMREKTCSEWIVQCL